MALQIGGNLPWSGAGGDMFSGDPATAYKSAYNAALNMNKQNYANILKGYQQTMQVQQQQQRGIQRGYGRLSNRVLGTIAGSDAAQRQDIRDQYVAAGGVQEQNLTNRGLGNTTVASAIARGLTLDEAKAQTNRANEFAKLTAGYQSNLGLAGLGYRERALGERTGLAGRQLDFMNSVQSAYPDAGAYLQLMQSQQTQVPPQGFGGGASISSGQPFGYTGGYTGTDWNALGATGGAYRKGAAPKIDYSLMPTRQSVQQPAWGSAAPALAGMTASLAGAGSLGLLGAYGMSQSYPSMGGGGVDETVYRSAPVY